MPATDGLLTATQFQIDNLTIISASGGKIDLREVMRELNIFEDLFSNTMTGSLFISDTQNLINLLPIVGGEYLNVSLSKPSTPWKLIKTFRVYKISDRRKQNQASEDYILHFCSEELIISQSTKISKSYKGLPVSSIIRDITATYLNIDSAKFPSSALTTTFGNFDIVVPFWSPFYTINWLARMARTSSSSGCSFMFFEDSTGYHFTSIETLSQQEPLQIINFMPMNLAGESGEKSEKTDTQMRLESAEEYEMSKAPDLIRQITTGMYAGKLVTVNPLSQKIDIKKLSGSTLFRNTNHLNPNSFMQLGDDRTRKPQTEHYDSFFRVASDSLKVDTWMLERNAYISALHGFQIKVSLPGNMYLRVGQVVRMNLPAATIGLKEEKPMDELFSGNYLITAIRHKIDRAKYVCILELSKDSIVPQLPTPLNGSAALDKIRKS